MRRIVLASIVLCGAVGSPSVVRAQTSRVLILRPRVRIVEDKGLLSPTSQSEGASEAVQAGLLGVLSRTFEKKGSTLVFDATAMAQWEETPPNDKTLKALWDDYEKTSETPLLTDLKKVTDSNQADVVVFTHASATVSAKIGKAKRAASDAVAVLGGVGTDARLYFSIGVVDVKTGRLLYNCTSTATGKYLEAPDSRLSGPVRKCLDQYLSPGHHWRWGF